MRIFTIVCAVLALSIGSALAAPSEVDGTWVGATPRGISIKVVIEGGKAKWYYFKGRSQGVVGGTFKGESASFGLLSNKSSKVVLRKQKGGTMLFVYTDNTGPDALKITLTQK